MHNVSSHHPSCPIPFPCLPPSWALHIPCYSQPRHVVNCFPLEAIRATTSLVVTDYWAPYWALQVGNMASHSAARPSLVSWQQKGTLETLFSLFLSPPCSVSSLPLLPSFSVPTPLGLGCSPCQGMTPPLCFYSGNARPFGEHGNVTQGSHLGQLVLCQCRNFLKGRGQLGTLCGPRNLIGVALCCSSRCHCETSVNDRQ